MIYRKTVTLKNGRVCTLRNAAAEDGQAVLDIFDAALDNASVQGVVDSELDKAVDKVKDSATFQNVVSFLQKCGKTAAEADAELRAAVMAWATENHLSGAEFKQSPLYKGGWLGGSERRRLRQKRGLPA